MTAGKLTTATALAAMVACGSPSAPIVANHAANPSSSPPSDPTPSAMCARLGAELGPIGGPTAGGGPASRQHALAVMCTKQRWSAKVVDCVDNADHDPLSCLRRPYLTDEQNARWNETFNAWFL